ncbi:MAG: hypothetical protein KA744_16280 [Phenylobacterium sp.]|nr:hypothetical protein [Phenylobacterium sp.]
MPIARGTRHGRAKLTTRQVQAIYRAYWRKTPRPSVRTLGARYGVSHQQVWRIVHQANWTHLWTRRDGTA